MSEASSLQELRDTAFRADPSVLMAALDERAAEQGEDAIFKEILGVAKIRSGDTAAGIAALSQAAADPAHTSDIRSLLILMRAYYGANELDATSEIVHRILQTDPVREPALRVAARIATLKGEDDQAEKFWRAVCDVSSETPEAALNVARIAQRRGDWETQAHFLDIALAADPQNLDALRQAVQVRLRLRRFEDFPKLIPPLCRHEPEKTLAYLRAVSGLDSAPALAATMAALRDAGLLDDAFAALNTELVHAWIIAGRRAGEKSQDAAARLFQAALLADPKARPALDELIKMSRSDLIAMRAAHKVGDFVAAEENAKKVLEVNPLQYEAWSTLARLHLDSRPLEAIPYLRQCISLEPEDPWPKLNLAKALERLEDWPAAVEIYDQLAHLTQPEVRHYRDDAAKAAANLRRRILGCAREAFRERRLFEAWTLCDPLRPEDMPNVDVAGLTTSIRRALIVSLRQKHAGHNPDFIEDAERYLERDPDEREVLLPLARALMARRSFERGLAIWRRLAALDADDPSFQVQIARCVRALGLRGDALATADPAPRPDPPPELASNGQEHAGPQTTTAGVSY